MRALIAVAAPLMAATVQAAAALIVLGPPDLFAASRFLTGELSMRGAIAASQLAVWFAVACVLGWTLLALALQLRRRSHVAAPLAQSWELAVLVGGVVVLAAGGIHHYAGAQTQLNGGTVQEAQNLAGG